MTFNWESLRESRSWPTGEERTSQKWVLNQILSLRNFVVYSGRRLNKATAVVFIEHQPCECMVWGFLSTNRFPHLRGFRSGLLACAGQLVFPVVPV